MSRSIAALACLAAASLLTGCAPGANDELRSLVDEIAPADRNTVGCEWESNWGSADVKSYYGCAWYVPGTIGRVGRPLVSRAIAKGFTVYCDGGEKTFEIAGVQGKKGLRVIVVAHGFVSSEQLVVDDAADIPPGHVLVSIGAAELEARAPGLDPSSRCVA